MEAFGDPRPIWREGSATRREPLPPRGTKRKSDELEIDELQAEELPRLSQSSFIPIEEFSDEGTFRKSKKHVSEPRISQDIETSKIKNSPRAGLSQSPRIKQDSGDELGSPSTWIKQSASKKPPPSSIVKSTPRQNSGNASVVKSEIDPSPVKTPSFRKASIADSEDDEEDPFHTERLSSLKKEPEDTQSQYFRSPVKANKPVFSLPKSEIEVDEPEIGVSNHCPASWQNSPAKGHDGTSVQPSVPTKAGKAPVTLQPAVSSSSSPPPCNETDIKNVRSFLAFRSDRTQAFLDDLHRSRRTVADEIYNHHVAGTSVPTELQSRPDEVSGKIRGVERLVTLRDEYLRLEKEKAQRKLDLVRAIDDEVHQSVYDQRYSNLRKASLRLSQIEAEMAGLVVATGLPAAVDPQKYQTSTSHQPTTQVKSTQAPRHDESSRGNDGGMPVSNDLDNISSRRTPVSKEHSASPSKSMYNNDAVGGRSPLRTYTSSAATKDVTAYFSPPKHRRDPPPQFERDHSASFEIIKTVPVTQTAEASRSDYGEDDEGLFSTHMENPRENLCDNEEYFPDDDEVDMLEVFEELERNPSIPPPKQNFPERSAFAETTGNIMRIEKPKNSSAFETSSQKSSLLQHPWSRDVKAAMSQRFHLRGFRPYQLDAINATLAGKDAFVLMPTGGGKSLCYQLPAIITSGKTQGVTVVISPLLSLMQDQVEHLTKLRIQALLINGEVTAEHRRLVMDCLKEHDPQKFCQLLYITPEMLSKSQSMINAFKNLHQRGKLARIVIDEAHCVSQWGHDFRPDYKLVGEVRRQFRGVPLIALTATATENVKVDVMHNLGMGNCEVFTQSFNRPNLQYEVRSKGKAKDVLDGIAETINTCYKRQTGIIYCLSKKNCENVAEKLHKDYGILAHHYHAGMQPEEKKNVQRKWQNGEYNVIVATIAFGMGIDKPNVRFVFHHTIPKSLEGYYQETGRAGRDGKISGCYLYYGYQDTSALKRMIDDGEGSFEQKDRQRQMLRNVVQFCENRSDCRRVQILNYFGETFSKDACNASCDNCKSKSRFENRDFSHYVPAALSLIRQVADDNVTLLHCVDVFRGSKTKKISEMGHDRLAEHGAGADIDRGNVERLFYRLVSEDAVAEHNIVNKGDFATNYVHVSGILKSSDASVRYLISCS